MTGTSWFNNNITDVRVIGNMYSFKLIVCVAGTACYVSYSHVKQCKHSMVTEAP